MKVTLLFILLLFVQGGGGGGGNSLTRIAETNKLKEQAARAYDEKRYADAAAYYETLLTHWGDSSDAVRLNRAHAYLLAQKKEEATEAYRQLAETKAGGPAKSSALQQLGYLASEEQKASVALQYFKEALKADPTNETARRNYEIAWRIAKKQEKKQEQEKDREDQPNEDQPKIKPSAWAEQQKARADQLYRQFRYSDALKLMQEGLKKDSTVAAYNDYIRRLNDIVEIDQ